MHCKGDKLSPQFEERPPKEKDGKKIEILQMIEDEDGRRPENDDDKAHIKYKKHKA